MEEGWSTYGVTAELAAGIQERCFDYLDAPILRLGGAQVPMPYSLPLEKASIPTTSESAMPSSPRYYCIQVSSA